MRIYVDSGFLVSMYVNDQHSSESWQRVLTAPRLWLTPLHRCGVGTRNSAARVRGEFGSAEAQQLHRQLEDDQRGGLWLGVDVPEEAFDLCADLARRHGAKFGVRTLDSLHVACALELRAERFWSFDDRLLKLARAVGLKTR